MSETSSNQQAPSVTFVVIDGRTGMQVGKPYTSRKRASARVDKLDNAYGAYRYRVEQRLSSTAR